MKRTRLPQRLRSAARDRRGGVTILAACSLIAMLATTALAVDAGTVFLAKRRLQGTADDAALAAAASPADASGAAQRTLTANALDRASVAALTQGHYAPDPALTPGQRYAAGATPSDAARVTLAQDVPLFFARAIGAGATTRIGASATAVRIDYAAFSIGSRLAAVQGGLPNALLSALAGTSLDLTIMDYDALAGADIDMLRFANALRTTMKIDGANYGSTLGTSITLPAALGALASVTDDPTAAAALRSVAARIAPTTVRLSDAIDLGPYAGQDHSDPSGTVRVNGYALLRELLTLGSGGRQVTLDLGLSLPGVSTTTLTLAIGQRPAHSPWLTIARDGSVVVRTAQSRLYIDSRVGGVATLGIASLRVPILIELAEAQARLAAIACARGPASASVTLDVQPAIGSIAIADIDTKTLGDFAVTPVENRALLAHAPLLDVTAKAHLALGGVTWQSVAFSRDDIAARRIRTVSTGDLTRGVASSLMSNMDLRVTTAGIGVNASGAAQLIGTVLTPVAPTLDTIVDQVTQLLGVHVGQADVRVDGVRCGKPTLVG